METGSGRWCIVVGVDGSKESHHALTWAQSEAAVHGGELHVVHAWAPYTAVSEVAVMATPINDELYEKAAHEVLAEALAGLPPDPSGSVALTSATVRGYPSSVLLEEAGDADLLVVGGRGRGGFTGLLLGSVSQQCVHHALRPVAVVPSAAPLPGTDDIVVGIDGSPGSASALAWAVDEAAIRDARLSVVHAWSTPFAVPPGGIGIAPLHRKDFLEQSERLLHEMVDGAMARAQRRPTDIELLPIEEPAAPALLHRAAGAGLLVVGSRGRGGFAALVLGSVSQQCLHHAPCAVVVIPHRG